jgi:hypothetical protein
LLYWNQWSLFLFLFPPDLSSLIPPLRTDPKGTILRAAQFAEFDIVVTTYTALQADLNHVDLNSRDIGLRHRKMYRSLPTPLLSVKWWRIILDEGQMVSGSTRHCSEMANRLETVHQWCSTGLVSVASYFVHFSFFFPSVFFISFSPQVRLSAIRWMNFMVCYYFLGSSLTPTKGLLVSRWQFVF